MKNRFFRPMSLLLMLAMVMALALPLSYAPPANAQGDFGCPLTADECDLIAGALNSLSTIESVNVNNLHVFLNFDAGPDTGAGTIEVNGSGPIVVTNEGIATFDTDMTLNLSADAEGEMDSITDARLMIKDDMVYAYDPEADEWFGSAISASDLEGLDELDPAALVEGLSLLGELTSDAVVWSHGDDIEVDGTNLEVFNIDVALGTLLTSDQVIEELSVLAAGMLDDGTDPESLSFLLGFLLADLGDQLDAGTFSLTMHVSEEDGRLYGFAFNIDQTVDLAFLADLAGGGAEGETIPPITLQLDLELSLGGYGEAYEIVPPETYTEEEGLNLDLGGVLP
jgi:hypothetical protein